MRISTVVIDPLVLYFANTYASMLLGIVLIDAQDLCLQLPKVVARNCLGLQIPCSALSPIASSKLLTSKGHVSFAS